MLGIKFTKIDNINKINIVIKYLNINYAYNGNMF